MEQGLRYNWCAFAVSILKKCTVEQAFTMMEEGANNRRYRVEWTQEDKDAIFQYRDSGMTNGEVGEMFGVGSCSISRIYNQEKRKKAARIEDDNRTDQRKITGKA